MIAWKCFRGGYVFISYSTFKANVKYFSDLPKEDKNHLDDDTSMFELETSDGEPVYFYVGI